MSKQIEALKKLGLTNEEIAEVLADDKRIDKGEKLFELSAEAEKASKKARTVAKAPTVYQFKPREKKVDNDKRKIISAVSVALLGLTDNVEITNAEREMIFTMNEKKYKIVLSCPRS